MEKLLLAAALIVFSGCATTDNTTTLPDGSEDFGEVQIESEFEDDSGVMGDEVYDFLEETPPEEDAFSEPVVDVPEESYTEPYTESYTEPEPAPQTDHIQTGYFTKTVRDCHVRTKPSIMSKSLNVVPKGRRLWVEQSNNAKWKSVYTKKQLAFMHNVCFGE